MVRRFVRQKYGSRGLVAALAVLALLELFNLASRGGEGGLAMANWAVFVLAAGSVSRDVSSGALQMILSRPIRRMEYLYGRYLGILAAYALFLLATSVLALLVVNLFVSSSVRGTTGITADRLAVAAGGAFLSGAFQAAILLLFSTFLPGIADLLGLLILYLVLHLPPWKKEWLQNAAEAARENMLPGVAWNDVLHGRGILGAATGRWVFALTVYLALAAVVFSRRELPYGQD